MKTDSAFPHSIQDSNIISKHAHGMDSDLLIKHYRAKPFNGKMVKYTILRWLGYEIPVEYQPAAFRREFEKACLELWHRRGFQVPRVLPLPEGSVVHHPALAMERVDGNRLDEFLADGRPSIEDKFAVLDTIFSEIRNRHCYAIFEDNHRLIHYDANLRNVIIKQGQPYYIDFEMGHLKEDIEKSAAREVKKITLQVLNAMGPGSTDKILRNLVSSYRIRRILHRLINEELSRPFIQLHLRRDAKRKKKKHNLITKIDLAKGLREIIDGSCRQKQPGISNNELSQAVETSWDGKFYQSIDDSDPRGRDMNHRYAVMDFPDDFTDRSILDIGCNIGRICMDAKKRGASRAIGLDHRKDVVDAMNAYFTRNDMDVSLFTFDINQGVDALSSLIGTKPFDYVCILSIWSHVDQQKLWDIVNRYCAKVCLFEDNAPSRIKSLDRIEQILKENLRFSQTRFMGFTVDRGVRAVFRLEK